MAWFSADGVAQEQFNDRRFAEHILTVATRMAQDPVVYSSLRSCTAVDSVDDGHEGICGFSRMFTHLEAFQLDRRHHRDIDRRRA
jgi:hypothetical protein